jgi:hypothetical protein
MRCMMHSVDAKGQVTFVIYSWRDLYLIFHFFLQNQSAHNSGTISWTHASRDISLCVEAGIILHNFALTLILLTWRIWWAPNNASKWQMGFNLVFKGLAQFENLQNFLNLYDSFWFNVIWHRWSAAPFIFYRRLAESGHCHAISHAYKLITLVI